MEALFLIDRRALPSSGSKFILNPTTRWTTHRSKSRLARTRSTFRPYVVKRWSHNPSESGVNETLVLHLVGPCHRNQKPPTLQLTQLTLDAGGRKGAGFGAEPGAICLNLGANFRKGAGFGATAVSLTKSISLKDLSQQSPEAATPRGQT